MSSKLDIELQPLQKLQPIEENHDERSQLDENDDINPQQKTQKLPSNVTYYQLFKSIIQLTLIDVLTLTATQYEAFQIMYVEQLKWIKEPIFEQTLSIVQDIPGATTLQLIAAIGTFSKKSALGGIMSVFFHSFPSAVILIIIAMVLREYKMRDLNVIVYLGLYGIRSSSVALIAHVCVKLIKQYIKNKINILMMVSSAIIFYTYPQSSTLITLIALGALSMLMIEYDTESRNENSSPSIQIFQSQLIQPRKQAENQNKQISVTNKHKYSNMIGTNSLHIYIIILLSLLWFRNKGIGEFLILDLSLTFYKIGTLIFGGTPIALPFMYAEIKNYEYMKLSEDAFWIGFALSAAIPGPYLNFTIFLATYTAGLVGGLSCWLIVYIPSILQFWCLLPYWQSLTQNQFFLKAREGITSVSIGFLLTAVYLAWVNASKIDIHTSSIISIISLIYILVLNFNCPTVIIFGAALFIVRYAALWIHRHLDPEILYFDEI